MTRLALVLVLLAAPARADFTCDDGTTDCFADESAHVNATVRDVLDVRELLANARRDAAVCMAGNRQLEADLAACHARVEASDADPPSVVPAFLLGGARRWHVEQGGSVFMEARDTCPANVPSRYAVSRRARRGQE